MTVHFLNGEFMLNKAGEELLVHPRMQEAELLISNFYIKHTAELQDMKNGYLWHRLGQVEWSGISFHAMLCFHESTLTALHLSLDGLEFPQSWEDWTEQAELLRKHKSDALLLERFGRKPDIRRNHPYPYVEYQFPWGTVSSSYDPRAASSSIAIQYKLSSD